MEPKYGQEIAKESKSNIKFHQEIRMCSHIQRYFHPHHVDTHIERTMVNYW